ncbi:hypothetical protein UCREL1_1698 [Eutypa lata UCREL1]|uniref:Uncharacterized protein n=1 Tax=Eutypa lata (strain UCR-EL1) TaxID=1287681 RepID=M7T3V1_EUTLA|nr:hypothetical protein UCREL1_1698 [Eutypa lata UCREL1]
MTGHMMAKATKSKPIIDKHTDLMDEPREKAAKLPLAKDMKNKMVGHFEQYMKKTQEEKEAAKAAKEIAK